MNKKSCILLFSIMAISSICFTLILSLSGNCQPTQNIEPFKNTSGSLISNEGGTNNNLRGTQAPEPSIIPDFELEKRVIALESIKQDLALWLTIFVTIVVILIGLNVGLSVYQVGSIAVKVVNQEIDKYYKKFEKYLIDDEITIGEQIDKYKVGLDELMVRVDHLKPELISNIEISKKVKDSLLSDIRGLLTNFNVECESIKRDAISEPEKWHKSKIANI